MTPFPGAERALAAHGPALPQPDQLCGPFSAWVALHALREAPPSVLALARAAGTRVWRHDEPSSRPTGSARVTTGWSELPDAAEPGDSGTDATGVAQAIEALTDLLVVPARGGDAGALARLLGALTALEHPIGVLANVRTGPIAPAAQHEWDVGHFVVLVGFNAGRREVVVADTYPEVGAPGSPPGCRVVPLDALHTGLAGRGLLLVVEPGRADAVRLEVSAPMTSSRWRT